MVISIVVNVRALAVSGSSSHYKEIRNKDFPCGPIAKIFTPNPGVPSSILRVKETRSHMPQLRIRMPQLKNGPHQGPMIRMYN